MKEKKMTRQEALEALKVYVKQEVDYQAIDVIESVIRELIRRPDCPGGFSGAKINIGNIGFDYQYQDILRTANGLRLGDLEPAPWLSKFLDLIAEIRKEYGLERLETCVGQDQGQYHDCDTPGAGIGPVTFK